MLYGLEHGVAQLLDYEQLRLVFEYFREGVFFADRSRAVVVGKQHGVLPLHNRDS